MNLPGRAAHPSVRVASLKAQAADEPTCGERGRDYVLAFLSHPLLSIWTIITILHFLLIIGWGATFFFLLMNWQACNLQHPCRVACNPGPRSLQPGAA